MNNKHEAIDTLLKVINRLTDDDLEIHVSIETNERFIYESDELHIDEQITTIKVTERFLKDEG